MTWTPVGHMPFPGLGQNLELWVNMHPTSNVLVKRPKCPAQGQESLLTAEQRNQVLQQHTLEVLKVAVDAETGDALCQGLPVP
jgi:hypothetical protein